MKKHTEVQNRNNSQFIIDIDKNKTLEDVSDYYTGVKVMTKEKFIEQQCGIIDDTIYFAQNNQNSMSLIVNHVSVQDNLNESELNMVEQAAKIDTGDSSNWNCFLQDEKDLSRVVKKEEVENISKYIFIDIQLTNINQKDYFIYLKEFKLLLTKENKMLDKDFYKTIKGNLRPYGFRSINSVLISSDKQIQYVTVQNTSNGKVNYYREPNRERATIKDAFYVDDTMNLRLMFVCTDEEIETGRLSLCSDVGNISQNGQFTNQGFVIELGEEIKNAADNQSGDE